jgi:hypothetical protein
LSKAEEGILTMTYRHRDYGTGRLVIDEKTLSPVKKEIKIEPEYPEALAELQSDFSGMDIRRSADIGSSREKGVRYILQWETLGRNYDRPRKPPLPQPSMLRLYKLSANDGTGTAKELKSDAVTRAR